MSQSITYFDLVQVDPKIYNDEQAAKRKAYRQKHGEEALEKLVYGKVHHELKRYLTRDFRLSPSELDTFKRDGLVIQNIKKSSYQVGTFGNQYLELYNNDLPVMISSDSLLYALHRLYDEYLAHIEEVKYVPLLKTITSSMLSQSLTQTSSDLQVLCLVPYILLRLQTLSKPLSLKSKGPTTDEVNQALTSKTKSNQHRWNYPNLDGIDQFIQQYNLTQTLDQIVDNPVLYSLFQQYKPADFDRNSVQVNDEVFDQAWSLIQSILNQDDIEFSLFRFNGSSFKPRGHYTKTLDLQKYFLTFHWLSSLTLAYESQLWDQTSAMTLKLLSLVESCQSEFQEFITFMEQIIGTPDSYTMTDFVKLTPLTAETLAQYIRDHPKQRTVGLMGEKFSDQPVTASFSLIGKSSNLDNYVIDQVTDRNLIDDKGSQTMRKFPSVLDVVDAVFGNYSVRETLESRHSYTYRTKLDTLNQECQTKLTNQGSLYTVSLHMLRAMTQDLMNSEVSVFRSPSYLKKCANTQIANYAELRHDNVLYLAESYGAMCECTYPDLIVEPLPQFWAEFANLIEKMDQLIDNSEQNYETQSFKTCLNNFRTVTQQIRYVQEHQFNANPPDISKLDNMKNQLRKIVNVRHMGSGEPIYTGWYANLFIDPEDSLKFKPEVSSMFTAPSDDRGQGGIVHLGTGPTRMMYLNVNGTLYLSPVSTAYEFITDYNQRLNDDDWQGQYTKYDPIALV